MRKLSLVLALVVGLFGFSSTANAGIVDITLYTAAVGPFQAGDITIRNDAGLNLFAVGMRMENGGAAGSLFTPIAGAGVDPGTSFSFTTPADLVAQVNTPLVPNMWIDSGGLEVKIGEVTNFGAITNFDCLGCLSFIGGAAFTDADGITTTGDTTDISAQVMYFIVPEPAALALLGLGLAGLAFVRRSAA